MARQEVVLRRARPALKPLPALTPRRVRYRDGDSAEELADASDLDREAQRAQRARVYRGETGISYDHRDEELGLSFWTPHD